MTRFGHSVCLECIENQGALSRTRTRTKTRGLEKGELISLVYYKKRKMKKEEEEEEEDDEEEKFDLESRNLLKNTLALLRFHLPI